MLIVTNARAQTTPCNADLDGDGEVSGGDISMLLVKWGSCSGAGCAGDLDADGEISGGDLSIMLVGWGPCAGPSWAIVLEWAPDPAVIYDSNLRSDIAATHLPWRVRDNGTGIEMVLIPPGSFMMGCSGSETYACADLENPPHPVTLTRSFYLGCTEVTQEQWRGFTGTNPSRFVASNGYPGSDARPVEQVGWDQARDFCSAANFRLPTEAEWEFAYRAGTTTAFHGWTACPNGTDDDRQFANIGWFLGNNGALGTSSYGTKQVKTKAANGFGLHDMAGNVFEWVNDRYANYTANAQIDPKGPETGAWVVLRGGFWNFTAGWCRASSRFDSVTDPASLIGFRVARDP